MTQESVVKPFGFDMVVEYDYDPGEPGIPSGDEAHPGTAAEACLCACRVGGVNIFNMLDDWQLERIETAILEQLGH